MAHGRGWEVWGMLGSLELFGLWVLEAVICVLLPAIFSIMEVSA